MMNAKQAKFFLITAAAIAWSASASAVNYDCRVVEKVDYQHTYTKEAIAKAKFSVRINDSQSPTLSRCSYEASEKRITCDEYSVDKVVQDPNVGIKKFYAFKNQFDVQLYPARANETELFFVENNGRGGIAYGFCKTVTP